MDKVKIIEKWYKALNFPARYDKEFYYALSYIKAEDFNIETYDTDEKDGVKNLVAYLYMCEELALKYSEKGIPDDILYDTLSDIKRWLDTYSEINGRLYLGELYWLKQHLSMNLFKIGRLQYAFGKAKNDIHNKKIKKGDNVIEVHIPADGPLLREDCENSLKMAKQFFEEFYPNYKFEYFTCHSWLLDRTLKEILAPESNIIKFQDMFEVIESEESFSILKYVFRWDATKENINLYDTRSSFAANVKDSINNGKKFYEALGVINHRSKR